MRSARVVSSVISRTLTLACACGIARTIDAATIVAVMRKRIKKAGRLKKPARLHATPESLIASEQHLQRPLHRARSAGSHHRIAAIDARRRADLAERRAANTGAQEAAEVHVIGHVEDLPSRLQPARVSELELLDDVHVQLGEGRKVITVAAAAAELAGC